MLLDVTHLADQSFWEALDIYSGPVLASHHNCRTLVPGDRQLTDEQIKALIHRGAVIGAAFDNWMIMPGWKIGVVGPEDGARWKTSSITSTTSASSPATPSTAAIGTDLDGGFGKEQSPCDLDTIADLQKLAEILERRGYTPTTSRGSCTQLRGILPAHWS